MLCHDLVVPLSWSDAFFLFQAEVAQLQEQVALKDAEIERLHSQLSRSAALHSDHAEKGNWLVRDRVKSPLGLGSLL